MSKQYKFKTRQLAEHLYEVIITAPNGMKFGRLYQAFQVIPNRVIFQSFLDEPKEFFIEVEAVLVSQLLLT